MIAAGRSGFFWSAVMYMNEVLKKCEEKGYKITKAGLYFAGQKYGFLSKPNGQRAWNFDKDKFLEWLNKAIEEVPKGWVTVKELSEKLNISIGKAYMLIKDEKAEARCIGSGSGVVYVDPKRIEEIIESRKKQHSYAWEE